MNSLNDFRIENGVLKKYEGEGGDVIIPDCVTRVDDYAFFNCKSLASITFPRSVKSIGKAAFSGCDALVSVSISDSVTSIEGSAFFGCEKLKSVILPDSITNIGDMAFASCRSLESINIPNGVTSIERSAFRDCVNLKSVTIPDSVTSVADITFYGCRSLTSITLPDSVKSIGNSAFGWCTSLTEITIPDSVESIGNMAFENCLSLISLIAPDKFEFLSDSAFCGCRRLADENGFLVIKNILYGFFGKDSQVVIPEGIIGIGAKAFYGCNSLESVTIPDSVVSIGDLAFFMCRNLASVTIPSGVKVIEESTFRGCENLTSVILHDGITSIGNRAFSDCKKLASAELPDSVTDIGDGSFWGCVNLESITVPCSLTSIGNNAFSKFVNVKFSGIPDTFESSALEVVWDYYVETEAKFSLMINYVVNYTDIVINNAKLNKKIKANKKKLIDVAIQNDNAEFAEKLFSLYKTIKLDELNEYIEKASSSTQLQAFLLAYKEKNYSLETQNRLESDNLEKELGLKERTVADWKKIFAFDTDGETATITGYKGEDTVVIVPEKIGKYKVVAVKDGAFNPYAPRLSEEQAKIRKNIQNVVLSGGIKTVGNSVFRACESLVSVTIPDSVTSIGYSAFSGCVSLTNVTIPDGVTSIGDYAFFSCSSLESVSVAKSVKTVGENAFGCCKNLKHIDLDFSEVETGNNAFDGCDSLTDENGFLINNGRLYCVRSDINEFFIPEGIKTVDDGVIIRRNVNGLKLDEHEISEEALKYYCKKKESISFPSRLQEIPDGKVTRPYPDSVYIEGFFAYNDTLKEVKLPDTLTKIGTYAFYKCANLKEISLHEGITQIGEGAFTCSGLRKVSIPSTVSVVSKQVFADCKELTSVNICEGVKEISDGAFFRCSALREICIPASVSYIDPFAFPSNKNKTIYAPAGSYAEEYAKQNKIKVKNEKEQISDDVLPFEYKISKSKTVKLTAYISDNAEVVIPAQIEGCEVTDFSKDIFKNNKQITSVVWPENITVLPKEIFFGCSALEKVVLPEGVVKISEKAFRNCISLNSIHIPSSVNEIHEKAFECAKNTMSGWKYWNCLEVVYGYSDSCAQSYAEENDIVFVAEE